MASLWHTIKLVLFYVSCYLLATCVALYLLVFGRFMPEAKKNIFKHRCISVIMWLVKVFFAIRISIENPHLLPAEPCVLMANHQSSLETFFLQLLCEPMSVVLKKELVGSVLLRSALSLADPVPLDRSKPAQAYRDLLKEGSLRLQKQRCILIFPEGTRVKIGEQGKFNRGAASLAHRAQVPLVPVAHNAGLCWPPVVHPQHTHIRVRIGAALDARNLSLDELYLQSCAWLQENRDALISAAQKNVTPQ